MRDTVSFLRVLPCKLCRRGSFDDEPVVLEAAIGDDIELLDRTTLGCRSCLQSISIFAVEVGREGKSSGAGPEN